MYRARYKGSLLRSVKGIDLKAPCKRVQCHRVIFLAATMRLRRNNGGKRIIAADIDGIRR